MLELRSVQGSLLKKVMESIKKSGERCQFRFLRHWFFSPSHGSSHVALVASSSGLTVLSTTAANCDWNLSNMSKMLRCAGNDDIVTIKADDGGDTVTFMFESPTQYKIADFEMKLMDIDSEHLGIPESEYEAIVRMPSTEFARICKDLSTIGDTVVISVTKEGVKFSTRGDIGTANIVCRQNTFVDKPEEGTIIKMQEPISLTFTLRYMNSFTKATPLGNQVTFSLSSELPMVVEYKIAEMGYIRYYLAPKIDEEVEAGTYAEPAQASPPWRPSPKMKLRQNLRLRVKQETKTEVESEPVLKSEPEEDSKTAVEINPKTDVNLETEADDEVEVMETKPETETNGEAEAMDVQ